MDNVLKIATPVCVPARNDKRARIKSGYNNFVVYITQKEGRGGGRAR